ncbi:MAG: Arc family DNA-binding protein [Firmicutes bacterium]|nr:Arc family DNA-binding protein [Bacillota bacterium]
MSIVHNISVKNIPDDLFYQLKQRARLNRRSINQEIIVCIENSVQGAVVEPEKLLKTARRLRKKTAAHPISKEELSRIKIGEEKLTALKKLGELETPVKRWKELKKEIAQGMIKG